MGWRDTAGLSRSHADTREHERPKLSRGARRRGHHAPDDDSRSDDVAPIGSVGDPRDRDADARIGQAEGDSGAQPKLDCAPGYIDLSRLQKPRQRPSNYESRRIGTGWF